MSANLASLARDIAALKAQAASAAVGDLRSRIHASRLAPPTAQHTRAQLEVLGQGSSLAARIARGMLRINFCRATDAPGTPQGMDPAVVLPQMAGLLYEDPLAFSLFAFDFGTERALCVVKLPDRYANRFTSEYGVESWAADFFDQIGQQVRERGFTGSAPVDAIRHAVSSGHGVSKSATTAMLVNWLMTTRPNARGVVTANTAPQLESKTWAELAKWTKRSVFGDWFDVTTGRGSMKMVAKTAPESWNVFGQTAAEERAESFAGLHAADSTPFYVFDEASAIPAAIWQVAEGGLTDGEPHFYAFGNPTRTGTKFFEAFNGQRHRWTTRQVDSRSCQLTNKTQINEWIEDFGVASDFVKVRVLGMFPTASSLQFIGRDIVDAAKVREAADVRGDTVVLGVDPARFGDDSSVIVTRIGRDARTWPVLRYSKLDTQQLASRVAERANFFRGAGRRVALNIDGTGVGGGVVDRLRSLGFDVNEIGFGERALDPRKFANRRAEIWGLMKEWLAVGALPDDQDLATDLCGVEYAFNTRDALQLESKASMKSRGLSSPDAGDALACTFGVTTPIAVLDDEDHWRSMERERLEVLAYDPMAPRRVGR